MKIVMTDWIPCPVLISLFPIIIDWKVISKKITKFKT